MRFLGKVAACLPGGRHQMIYTYTNNGIPYHVQFDEIVDYDDSSVELPDGILSGVRPDRVTVRGGCYELLFDLVSNIENNTSFHPRKMPTFAVVSGIVEECLIKHYNTHTPYCYVFLANTVALYRLYRILIGNFKEKNPEIILTTHIELMPERRGYAIELHT